jgi:2-C-methyl-D-erythritol 4-phosphate cytidylyltransferase
MKKLNIALIVAAGKGARMGSKISKQFLQINEKPILYYTIKSFVECNKIDAIALVLAEEDIEYVKREILGKYELNKVTVLAAGGKERQQSVLKGLKALDNCGIVVIHDGARPFVSRDTIEKGIVYAEEYGAAACGVKPKDTIKVIDNEGFSLSTPDRDSLISVQTPQCFNFDLILKCHEKSELEGFKATDDTMVAEHYGNKVFLYEGDYKNIKITTPEDMLIGEEILKQMY